MAATWEELDRLVERVRKLLALSRSDNRHEAALAATKARELLARHGLSLATIEAELAGEGRPAYVSERFDSGGWTDWRRRLLAAVVRHHSCRGVSFRGTRDVGIVGAAHDVVAVRRLYAFLAGEVARLADAGAREQPDLDPERAHAWKRSFYQGAARTIARRLAERQWRQDAAAAPHDAALLVNKERALDEAYRQHFPGARPAPDPPPGDRQDEGRGARKPRSADGYRAGVRAAQTIPLEPVLADPRAPAGVAGR